MDDPVTVNGQPGGDESFYAGYDLRNARWVLVSIGSTGTYDIATSSSPHFNGSRWTGGYPAGSGTSTFTENSPSQYTIAQTSTMNGQTTTMTEVCMRHK